MQSEYLLQNTLSVFTLRVWGSVCVWSLCEHSGQRFVTTAWHHCRRWQPRCSLDKMNFGNFWPLFLRWWRFVLVKDCLVQPPPNPRDAQSGPVNPRLLQRSELGVNFEVRKEARSQQLPNKFWLSEAEHTSRLYAPIFLQQWSKWWKHTVFPPLCRSCFGNVLSLQ